MATDAAAADDKPAKTLPWRQNKEDETKRHRSVFEVPPDLFDSCRLLHSPFSSFSDSDIYALEESKLENEVIENRNSTTANDAKVMQRWSCNTCKMEFESLQEQRLHFKSDLHRLNIKLSIAGKTIIKEEDFDGATSDSLCKDYDVSSISGSEDEDERDSGLLADRQREFRGISKSKIFIELQNGERVSVWKCLLLDASENISLETDKSLVMDGAGVIYLTQRQVIEKLKYILREPRDNTYLRIVLLAKGGHFAGCVFDGNSLVAHKTFHRYVVRAKAGKKQSSKDAGGRTIHSAGASLRRYNELALKKAEKDAKRKAKAKEMKKLKKAKEKKKAQAEAARSQNDTGKFGSSSVSSHKGHGSAISSKEEEERRIQEEREKRAAAAERRMAAALKAQETAPSNLLLNNHNNTGGSEILCSCCNVSLAGKVPFHRYHYKYCSTSCMHVHREILEDG